MIAIEPLRVEHWPAAAAIYLEGIRTGAATFETAAPSWEEWDASHHSEHRLAAMRDGELLGWAALGPVSRRPCYAGVAEVSVYVAEAARGRGVGRQLLSALVAGADAAGLWTLQAGIFPENVASIALHRRCGFRVVGVRERIGRLGGEWRDVVVLERRSPAVS
jgi:phosphinothricin acetyltransferase